MYKQRSIRAKATSINRALWILKAYKFDIKYIELKKRRQQKIKHVVYTNEMI